MHPRTNEILDYLDSSDRSLDDAVAAVPVSSRDRRPAPDRWSTAEVLEHLSIVERSVSELVRRELDAARARGLGYDESTDPVVPKTPITKLLNREVKIVAGERSQPKAGLAWQAAREALAMARAGTRELVIASDGLALGELVMPHPALGPLNGHQWLVFLGAHEQRHAAQIREGGATASA